MVTIARQYVVKISITKVGEYSKTELRGATAAGLKDAAEKIGFSAKIVRVTDKSNISAEFPKSVIAHIFRDNTTHYVVIHKETSKYILIADPSRGIGKMSKEKFFEYWSGILILMVPKSSFESNNKEEGLINRFWSIIKLQKKL